jgi:hypothetical protein
LAAALATCGVRADADGEVFPVGEVDVDAPNLLPFGGYEQDVHLSDGAPGEQSSGAQPGAVRP